MTDGLYTSGNPDGQRPTNTPGLPLSEGVPTSVGSRTQLAEEHHAEATPSESGKPLPTLEEVQGIYTAGRLRGALREIADFPIREDMSAGWHFAEVRLIARDALADDELREGVSR